MNKLKYNFLGALVFLGTFIFWYFSYAYVVWVDLPSNVTSWTSLTSDIWNNTMTAINSIWARTDGIYSSWWSIWIWTNSPQAKLDVNWTIKASWQPHIFWSLTKTDAVNGMANSFTTASSRWWLTWSWDRINITTAGVYMITFTTISSSSTGRIDAHILKNGSPICNLLSENDTTWYHQKTWTVTVYLNVWDYIQFDNQDWWNNTSTIFQAWRTASVTMIN